MNSMKGQSKALELVVALFVLLIVAWLVISLVTQFFNKGQTNISGQIDELKENQLIDSAKQECEQKCSAIKSASGSEGKIVDFCSGVPQSAGSGLLIGSATNATGKSGYAELNGVGICRESVPCFELIDCAYPEGSQKIDAAACKRNICAYYSTLLTSDQRVDEELNKRILPGKCYKSTMDLHWYAIAFGAKDAGTLTCGG
ncbi:Uncharacterised protein [Candidatus Gugararchaeum adminiculabundum]|nr:Uncharacterised protein [Candidatus Gugararchaeum adminiculabundum]